MRYLILLVLVGCGSEGSSSEETLSSKDMLVGTEVGSGFYRPHDTLSATCVHPEELICRSAETCGPRGKEWCCVCMP